MTINNNKKQQVKINFEISIDLTTSLHSVKTDHY